MRGICVPGLDSCPTSLTPPASRVTLLGMNQNQARALAELQQKSLLQIQRETAHTWAYRAWAAQRLGFMHDEVEYRHEALEHAALTEHDDVLSEVRAIMAAD